MLGGLPRKGAAMGQGGSSANDAKFMDQIFNLKFTSKQLQRQAAKCEKEVCTEAIRQVVGVTSLGLARPARPGHQRSGKPFKSCPARAVRRHPPRRVGLLGPGTHNPPEEKPLFTLSLFLTTQQYAVTVKH